jgi:IS4 transposase
MTANESRNLSLQIKDLLQKDLSHLFHSGIPFDLIEQQARALNPDSRDRIFTPCNVILTMLLSATKVDKSLQEALNTFKTVFEHNSQKVLEAETAQLRQEKINDGLIKRTSGRPKKYRSRIPKSHLNTLSDSTSGYSTARKRLETELVQTVFEHSTDFGNLDNESWHGMTTYITDGTYLQLQDTEDIKSEYVVKNREDSYPQALLQVLIRQGSGQISQFSLSSRQTSELALVVPMIKKLGKNSLLLADDLYNSYYHFGLTLSRECHIIVPGKRHRNYNVIQKISENDLIVEISKTKCPDYVCKDEWDALPDTIKLRRITYNYPTKKGVESAVLYTTLLDAKIPAADIVAKYTMRWDIEISIREIKTIMDINVLRSKSREMLFKELLTALTAYNLIRKIIAKAADKVGISPQKGILQECNPFGGTVFLDKRGRVLFKKSPGRYGYPDGANKQTSDTAPKRENATLSKKN